MYKQGMSPNRFLFLQGQIFNEFNARKPEEINVFAGMTKNKLFMAIIGITAVLQVSFVLQLFLAQFVRRNCWILTMKADSLMCRPGNHHRAPWEIYQYSEAELDNVDHLGLNWNCEVRFNTLFPKIYTVQHFPQRSVNDITLNSQLASRGSWKIHPCSQHSIVQAVLEAFQAMQNLSGFLSHIFAWNVGSNL